MADEEQEKMLGSPGAHLILIFTRHVNEGRVERGSMHGKIRDVSHFTDSLDQKGSCLAQASRVFSRAYQNSLSHANLPIYLANHATCASQRFLIIRHRKKMIRVTFGVEEVAYLRSEAFEE
jgi:hypothetical protein